MKREKTKKNLHPCLQRHVLVCYLFKDGTRAYFHKGDKKQHIRVLPAEILTLQRGDFTHFESQTVNINYSTWCKLI